MKKENDQTNNFTIWDWPQSPFKQKLRAVNYQNIKQELDDDYKTNEGKACCVKSHCLGTEFPWLGVILSWCPTKHSLLPNLQITPHWSSTPSPSISHYALPCTESTFIYYLQLLSCHCGLSQIYSHRYITISHLLYTKSHFTRTSEEEIVD